MIRLSKFVNEVVGERLVDTSSTDRMKPSVLMKLDVEGGLDMIGAFRHPTIVMHFQAVS